MERQSTFSSHLSRQSTRSSVPNIFSDDNGYSLHAHESHDDQHRSSIHDDADRDPSGGYRAETPRRSTSTGQGPPYVGTQNRNMGREHVSQQPTRQSSMVSHLSHSYSMASVSDEGASSSTPRRSTRTTSSFGMTRAQSPYQGATGPSHPYALYAQDTALSRTASIATTSTVRRPERSYSGPRGPTQPYALYPQNTVDEDDDDDPFDDSNRVLEASYPAGSRPAPRAYNRRLGPDGEDVDDLIGPDGYAEQLPPYTRYPNDIPPKQDPDAANYPEPPHVPPSSAPRAAAQAVPDPSPSSTPHAAASDETLHNRTASNDNIYVSHTLAQTSSRNPLGNQTTPSSSTTAVEATTSQQEKGNLTQPAQGRSKRRVCWGLMPCWLLAALLSFLVAIIIGAVIGVLLAHKSGVRKGAQRVSEAQASPSPSVVPVTTVTSILPAQTPEDAAPLLSTPAHLPPMPTGSYNVTLENPSTISNSCITDPQKNNAWDCATGAILQVDIQMTTLNNAPTPYINIQYPGPPPYKPIRYGAQPPELLGPTDLILMRDRTAFHRGPAYTFQQPFNKTVVVREQDFPGSIPNTPPRDKRDLGSKWFDVATGFMGLSKRQSGDNQSDFDQNLYAGPRDRPWFCFWNGTYLDGFIYIYDQAAHTSTAAAAPSSSPSYYKREDGPSRPYPKTIKIEERRDVLPSQAYCQQFQILDNWRLGPVGRDDGSPNIVKIEEDESDQASTIRQAKIHNGGGRLRRSLLRSRDITNEGNMCQCSWGNS